MHAPSRALHPSAYSYRIIPPGVAAHGRNSQHCLLPPASCRLITILCAFECPHVRVCPQWMESGEGCLAIACPGNQEPGDRCLLGLDCLISLSLRRSIVLCHYVISCCTVPYKIAPITPHVHLSRMVTYLLGRLWRIRLGWGTVVVKV